MILYRCINRWLWVTTLAVRCRVAGVVTPSSSQCTNNTFSTLYVFLFQLFCIIK